jgi:hypothetical protein
MFFPVLRALTRENHGLRQLILDHLNVLSSNESRARLFHHLDPLVRPQSLISDSTSHTIKAKIKTQNVPKQLKSVHRHFSSPLLTIVVPDKI